MLKENYSDRYKNDKITPVYPVEFVVRAFLGSYPGLVMPKKDYQGKKILDLGYGDGRNMPLLNNLGMKISGVEISEDINLHVAARLKSLNIDAILKLGTNSNIPFDDNFFNYVLACHSCYYVEPGQSFNDNIAEIARVIEPNGYLIASVPMSDTYILKDSIITSEGHYQITNDPFGIRNGTILRAFKNEEELKATLDPYFGSFSIGFCDDMFWGIHQKVWTVVCRKKNK
jgi:SAM-dependent methyltransferase